MKYENEKLHRQPSVFANFEFQGLPWAVQSQAPLRPLAIRKVPPLLKRKERQSRRVPQLSTRFTKYLKFLSIPRTNSQPTNNSTMKWIATTGQWIRLRLLLWRKPLASASPASRAESRIPMRMFVKLSDPETGEFDIAQTIDIRIMAHVLFAGPSGCRTNKSCCGRSVAICFTTPPVIGADGIGTAFGNSGTGIIDGPGQANLDLAVTKAVTVAWPRENSTVEFRAELQDRTKGTD